MVRSNKEKQQVEVREYTWAEVKKHNTSNDGWIVLKIKGHYCVFDVTKWIPLHPGGPELVIRHLGKDATNDFEQIGHPAYVYETVLAKYFIGKIFRKKVP
jgi:cytochrome b involved in lipid metabolism